MKCLACQHDNALNAKFCQDCGAKLARACSSCNTVLDAAAKFCPECGASAAGARLAGELPLRRVADYTPKHLADKILQSKSALEGERKQVTVLFADIQGSMQLATQLDPEQWHQLLERFFAILTDAVHRFEGTVNQYTGDGIMALFGAPIAHEDHAQRACHAALHARDQLRAFSDELRLKQGLNFSFRIGLNSGDVVVGKISDDLRMDYTAQGATVGIAQRIEQLAAPGHVYLSGATERLVAGYFQLRAMGTAELKGLTEAVPLFELEGVGTSRTRLEVAISRGLSPFVGRAAEMQTLEAALARAQSGHGQVIGIVGEPGLGKSRLCLEFVARCSAEGLPVFQAHCPAHGKNIPYLPILELFRHYFDIRDHDMPEAARGKITRLILSLDHALAETLPVLFEFMGVTNPDQPIPSIDAEMKQRQLYDLVHKVMRAQDAQGRLTVTMIDDMHWIDPGSDGFVSQIVNAAEGRRCVIVLNFRPEYIAPFAGKAHYQQLPLVPLTLASAQAMIADLVGRDPSVAALTERIAEWTHGNPFYVEELVTSLSEAGELLGRRGDYCLTVPLEHLQIPSNVRAVLAARIDRLPEAAKRLLQTAAVIGKEFDSAVLDRVSNLAAPERATAIERLKAGDFIHERSLYPIVEYAFKHPLTHEVAYQSQLQSRRALVHVDVAQAIEATAGDRLDELAALLAHHYQAGEQHINAARWHKRAAEWAGKSDINAEVTHWQQVRKLAGKEVAHADSAPLLIAACSAMLAHGWRTGATAEECSALYQEGCAAAERTNNLGALVSFNASYGAVRGLNQAFAPDYAHYTAEAVRIADRSESDGLRAAARSFLSMGLFHCGRCAEAKVVAEAAVTLTGGDPHLGARLYGFSPLIVAQLCSLRYRGLSQAPIATLPEIIRLREYALESGYPEQALWLSWLESELKVVTRISGGTPELAKQAAELPVPRGLSNYVLAHLVLCDELFCSRKWQQLRDTAARIAELMQERNALVTLIPMFLAHQGNAWLALDDAPRARELAREGIAFMEESCSMWRPDVYVLMARAQLALGEPAATITASLATCEEVLLRCGFDVWVGEVYEMRAELAAREHDRAAHDAALAQAYASYRRFGLTEREDALRRKAGS